MTTLGDYRKFWHKKALKDEIRKEELRKQALKIAHRLKDVLAVEFGVKKVFLFGSILQKGYFNEDSDIDIAVEGLKKGSYFTALARLMAESQFDVDLKPIEDIRGLLKERIDRGEVIYEKREDS